MIKIDAGSFLITQVGKVAVVRILRYDSDLVGGELLNYLVDDRPKNQESP